MTKKELAIVYSKYMWIRGVLRSIRDITDQFNHAPWAIAEDVMEMKSESQYVFRMANDLHSALYVESEKLREVIENKLGIRDILEGDD